VISNTQLGASASISAPATQKLGAQMLVGQTPLVPIFPWIGDYRNPKPHCNATQVMAYLMGANLRSVRDPDGSLTTFTQNLQNVFIPQVTADVVKALRTNLDYTKTIWFFEGTGSNKLTLPYRYIQYVNAVFLRVIQTTMWYVFFRPRKIDGSEFAAIGGIEPAVPAPEQIPPSMLPSTEPSVIQYTGIEDADLLIDTRRRTIYIPPRVLIAGFSTPIWSYNFFHGVMNVEVHFVYGFPPTAYLDGQPLVIDLKTGIVGLTSPKSPNFPGGQGIDWSSGMPAGFTAMVAELVANRVRRILWQGSSQGLSSISVDGATESYGPAPYGGSLDVRDKEIMLRLGQYGITMI
jgi:hypothetical protein